MVDAQKKQEEQSVECLASFWIVSGNVQKII